MILDSAAYLKFKECTMHGRYITNKDIVTYLANNGKDLCYESIGYSVNHQKIYAITIGTGKHKLLLWSQMHGNESTTTKAVFDLLNYLQTATKEAQDILANCTLKIIPILNPDGAEAYTRKNANKVDLNRDAQELSQPESLVLRSIFKSFKPDYCFNLHDQRTIFSAGKRPKPATVSFLAPAHDHERSISKTRALSMQLIVAMKHALQKVLPDQIGRYDDSFNANCVGDAFQIMNTPTILFEAGHYPNDYEREQTRMYIFLALTTAMHCISKDNLNRYSEKEYNLIPENEKLYFDVIIKNIENVNPSLRGSMALLFTEVLNNNTIEFEPKIEKIGDLEGFFAHKLFDCLLAADLEKLKHQNYWKLVSTHKIE